MEEWCNLWRFRIHEPDLEDRVAAFLKEGVDPRQEITPNWTPMGVLMSTSGLGGCPHPWSLIQRLLDAGVGINDICGNRSTALVVASSRQPVEIIAGLLDAGADQLAASGSFSLASSAMTNKDPKVLPLLLRRGIDPNGCDLQGEPVLHLAIQKKNWMLAELLMRQGANLGAMGPLGEHCLIKICQNARTEARPAIQLALDLGADPNGRGGRDRTALIYLASNAQPSFIPLLNMLLGSGADPRLLDRDGRSPISALPAHMRNSPWEDILTAAAVDLDASDIAVATPQAPAKASARRM